MHPRTSPPSPIPHAKLRAAFGSGSAYERLRFGVVGQRANTGLTEEITGCLTGERIALRLRMRALGAAIAELGAVADVPEGASGARKGAEARVGRVAVASFGVAVQATVRAEPRSFIVEGDADSGAPGFLCVGVARQSEVVDVARVGADAATSVATAPRALFIASADRSTEAGVSVRRGGLASEVGTLTAFRHIGRSERA